MKPRTPSHIIHVRQVNKPPQICTLNGMGPFKCYVTQRGVGGQIFQKKALRRCKVQRYLALRGGGWGSNLQGKKRYVTLEWPLYGALLISETVQTKQ